MDTPPDIRLQYASPAEESPEQRRRRLANRRAAKYRYFKSQRAPDAQREENAQRQRRRRAQLDEDARARVRAQNRRRQQLRRDALSESEREQVREKQRERQRRRRQSLDEQSRQELREKERLRVRRRRQKEDERLPFGDGGQVTLPPPMEVTRFPLPHLQQVTPLFPMPSSTARPHTTPTVPSVSLALPMGQPRTPIVLPPAHRSLPPLPDFLSSREAFNPANAAVDTRPTRRSSASRALFPSADIHDAQDPDAFFQR